jgi:hypothetical protein
MITLSVKYKNFFYSIDCHGDDFYPHETQLDIRQKLMNYFIKQSGNHNSSPLGDCVVCYDNKIGIYMGCCNFKQFLCVDCISELYKAQSPYCPCCRDNLLPIMNDRMKQEKTLIEKEMEVNYYLRKAMNKRVDIQKIINDLYKFNINMIIEEKIKIFCDIDDESGSYLLQICDNEYGYFCSITSRIYFSKIQRKIGFKPINLVLQNKNKINC